MNRRNFLSRNVLGLSVTLAIGAITGKLHAQNTDPSRPNIVMILIDDMGLMDLESYGSTYYETPNINKLASEGMQFNNAYAAGNVCSPSRHAILTGKYPGRTHFTNVKYYKDKMAAKRKLNGVEQQGDLKESETIFAEAFKANGYNTAFIGKWHVGGEHGVKHGFDHWEEIKSEGGKYPWPPVIENEDPKEVKEIFDKSIKFIKKTINEKKPFMLYMSHRTVHVELQTTQTLHDKYAEKTPGKNGQNNPYYAGMVEDLDAKLGSFLRMLEKAGLGENTVIVLTSDNGGLRSAGGKRVTSNEPLRGGKGLWYEGGTRVPLIIKWPGNAKPGSKSSLPTIGMDLYPTMLEMANIPLMPKQHMDGVSLVGELKGQNEVKRDALFWHYPHYKAICKPHTAVVSGNYKMTVFHEEELSPHGGPKKELFDLTKDPGEKNNLIDTHPDLANELYAKIKKHRKDLKVQMPTVNENYVPGEGQKKKK